MNDEIRILTEGWRLLGQEVQTELIARGWAVTDLAVADDQHLEFFWPPTAPHGHGGSKAAGSADPGLAPEHPLQRMFSGTPMMFSDGPTPWLEPTRVTRSGEGWLVSYGRTAATEPDAPTVHADDAALLADLERIEWWPMSVAQATQEQRLRLWNLVWASAHDDFYEECRWHTEPYLTRAAELATPPAAAGNPGGDPASVPPPGDRRSQGLLIEAEAWTSSMRTAQAAGPDWMSDPGPEAEPSS